MSGYKTVVVGTDGSGPSMKAVEHAAWIAAASNGKLIITMAYVHHGDEAPYHISEQARAEDLLKGEGWELHGDAPIQEWLHDARERAEAVGATNIEVRPIVGDPADVLVNLVEEVKADLLVVGNLGMTTLKGRLLGSVPANITHHAKTDILVVHTRD